ncbi:NEDD8 ultimate buster 1-like [Melitaea cinxia]|uniref:NEDD8 ultimate buster 1-like n=1 Tax=Melitaea cinxia TaxID=113334 RepID=UPI001E273128|nr:NEDD8 ultimate buster 1-like [Melitaea cinxia]
MDNLEHEDLLIKLRAKLNEEKIKLWESPYVLESGEISPSLKELADKYSKTLKIDSDTVLEGLYELQKHSIERLKANEEFEETGCATLRVKATITGERPRLIKILKPLSLKGEDLISSVAELLDVDQKRIKLIYNGKLINCNTSLEEQGLKNGAQLMALVMAESPEQVKKEDNMYKEMKSTLDDVTLLTEYIDDVADDEEYMKLEDQSGKAVELPRSERKSLLIGLALHERGRAAAKNKDYALALVLLLEADRQLNECRSSILSSVDNCAVLQLDIAWCYLCLQNLSSTNDAALRLARAEKSFIATYGEDHQRLIALKGTNANERVLFMRLYLLQGVVAFHQNKREEARRLLEKAEAELNYLKVDEAAVATLMELGWSEGQARTGLRASGGDLDRAHQLLEDKRGERERARERHKVDREQRALGSCADGSVVNAGLVRALQGMGFTRRLAVMALRHTNNDVTEAVRVIQDHPELLADDSDLSDIEDMETQSSNDSLLEPDNRLVAELEAMGYPTENARMALRLSGNQVNKAVDLLVAGCCGLCDGANPSTSAGVSKKKVKKEAKEKRKKEREMALRRLKNAIRADEDDYLSGSLAEEEQFLVQYKSLL